MVPVADAVVDQVPLRVLTPAEASVNQSAGRTIVAIIVPVAAADVLAGGVPV